MIMFKEKFRCYEAKIEESEKASSRRESNPGHLACAASALPLSHNNQTITSPHNPLHVLIMFASTLVFHQGNTFDSCFRYLSHCVNSLHYWGSCYAADCQQGIEVWATAKTVSSRGDFYDAVA